MADLPIGRKKKDRKHKKGGTNHQNGDNDEEWDSNDDNQSFISEDGSVDSQFPLDENEDGMELIEDFEGKLRENIENCQQKGSNGRVAALIEVQKAFRRRYIGEFLSERVDTLTDILEKLLKRGQRQDRILASELCCLFCLQVGEDNSTKMFNNLKPTLLSLLSDDTISPEERAAACSALGTSCIIADVEMEDMVICLNALKASFSKKVPSGEQQHLAFASSLNAWSLILSIADDSIACDQIQNCVGVLCKLLELGSLNLRIAAGETAALVHELAYNNRMPLQGPMDNLLSYLQEFANESGRHKGKREKKQQKSSFRDILKSVKGNQPPEQTIKFGPEFIEIGSWSWLLRYRAFKKALGPGTNIHLQSNPFMRDMFDLGIPLPKELKESKVSKFEKQLVNSASSKHRTQKRNLRRDNKQSASHM